MIVVSIGCPAGIGPEVSVSAAAKLTGVERVLVGDAGVIARAAKVVGAEHVNFEFLSAQTLHKKQLKKNVVYVLEAGPQLTAQDRNPHRVSAAAGVAQLEYIEVAYDFAKERGAALVTGPVSKAAVAHSGLPRARSFLGHTEWLEKLDGAPYSVMCFSAEQLTTSLVTTHVPLNKVSRAVTATGVRNATYELARLLTRLGAKKPVVYVASLNPHAGESELLGGEELKAILPGIEQARKELKSKAQIIGPVGAETAYRKAYAAYQELGKAPGVGVVAMYHDQATIPMKTVAFGTAVNLTLGLSIIRTSVDHGTAYDIAWQGKASDEGMLSAMKLALRLQARK